MSDSEGGGSYSLHNVMVNLATRVGSLEGALKTFMENWALQDKLAHDARRTTYERVDLLGRQIERIATDVNNIQQDVAELKKEIDEEVTPVVKAYETQTAKALGAKGVWALIGGVAIAAVSAFAYVADKIAAYLFPKA
jgi:hypothetical protein